METPKTAEMAHIGRSVVIKGELSGSEDLFVDGTVEGTIVLRGNSLTVGPNGQVKANVNAKSVAIHGKIEGNVRASERVELTKSAVAIGDIFAQRVAIEDGAFFKGKIDIQKDAPKAAANPAPTVSANATTDIAKGAVAPSGATNFGSGSATEPGRTPVTEQKKL